MTSMNDQNKRNYFMKFRVNSKEKRYIENQFKRSNLKSLSKFLRYKVVFGKVISFSQSDITFLKKQLAGACTNLNQIAKNTNRNKSVSPTDFENLRQVSAELQNVYRAISAIEERINMELKE